MDDRLKRKLYDAFLKDTPVSFESVTDKQFADMQATLTGFSITLQSITQDIWQSVSEILKPVITTINDVLERSKKDGKR